jgi:hypothetical protein
VLAAAAAQQCRTSPAGKKVSIHAGDLEGLETRTRFAAALSEFALSRAADPARQIGQVADRVAGGGGFSAVEFARPQDAAEPPRAAGPAPAEAALRNGFEAHGFALRVNEDLSAQFRPRIIEAWLKARRLPAYIADSPLADGHKNRLMTTLERECAAWTARLDAIEQGTLTIRRLLAFKNADPIE